MIRRIAALVMEALYGKPVEPPSWACVFFVVIMLVIFALLAFGDMPEH